MNIADKIRTMSDEEMAAFLFQWTYKNLAAFFERGGAGCMNAAELKEWLKQEDTENENHQGKL